MSGKPLDAIGGVGGGPVKIAGDPGRVRNIHITVLNPTAATHLVAFGRTQREITDSHPNGGLPGFVLIAIANNVVTSTVNGIAYTSIILQAWIGELWAIADVAGGQLRIDVIDSSSPEK